MSHSTIPFFETGIAAQGDGVTYNYFAFPGSLCLLPGGKLLTVFTAKVMDGPDEGVGIYSSDGGKTWSSPQTLFGGPMLSEASIDLAESYADPNLVVIDEKRVMAFCVSLLYAKGELDLRRTRFWRRISEDGGQSFGPVEEMPRHKKYYTGTVHPGLRLQNGSLVMGYSWDKTAESGAPALGEGQMDICSGVLISQDEGLTWTIGQDLTVEAEKAAQHQAEATGGFDEPALVELPDGRLFILGRTGTNRLWQSFSHDGGRTWEPSAPSLLESHNCPASLLRLREDDAVLVAYNAHPLERARLSLALSLDGCESWTAPKPFAPIGHIDRPQASYPQMCELPDGTIVLVFGQIDMDGPDRRFVIRYIRFNRAWLTAR